MSDMRLKRLKKIKISRELAARCLKAGFSVGYKSDAPEDIEVIDAEWDPAMESVILTVSSSSFPLVAESSIPPLEITFHSVGSAIAE